MLEETHYYPFGLTMAGISSKAAGGLENKQGYNGNELQDKEFIDGSGLDLYSTEFRSYDPQIGRWNQIDPLGEANLNWSSYSFAQNNPIRYKDPLGLDTLNSTGKKDKTTGETIYTGPNAENSVVLKPGKKSTFTSFINWTEKKSGEAWDWTKRKSSDIVSPLIYVSTAVGSSVYDGVGEAWNKSIADIKNGQWPNLEGGDVSNYTGRTFKLENWKLKVVIDPQQGKYTMTDEESNELAMSTVQVVLLRMKVVPALNVSGSVIVNKAATAAANYGANKAIEAPFKKILKQ